MPDRVRGLTLNESLDEVWLSEHELLCRLELGDGDWRYILVDGRIGQESDAFDHHAMARALSELISAELEPGRLPIDRIALLEDKLLVLLEDELRVFTIERGAAEVEEVAIEAARPFLLEPVRRRRSRDAGGETSVLFINRSEETIETVWLDREGGRRSYGTIEPGGRRRQHTFTGHVWLIIGEDGRELGVYTARRDAGIILIDGQPHTAPPRPERRIQPPHRSPDGKWEALIRDHNVILKNEETGEESPLSTDGSADDRYTGEIYWSPDSSTLAVMRMIPEQAHTVNLVESAPDDQVQPKLHSFQYLKPGDRIAHPRPRLFDVASCDEIEVSDELYSNPWQIMAPVWTPDGSEFTFVYNERGHQTLRLIGINGKTGEVRTIIDEQSETFIDYAAKFYLHRVNNTGELIWMSERDGWNHLYLIDSATGQVKNRITEGEWLVRGVDRVDEDRREIHFRALGVYPDQDPYHVHYGRVNFDGSGLIWLTEGDGTHELRSSPNGEYYIDTWSRIDLPPVHELRRTSNGQLIAEIARADWTPLVETGWRAPERFVAKGRDDSTDIWGVIFYPSDFDPNENYPIIENIYAGPHGHFVPKSYNAWHGSRELAELGFIVVQIDGMGTNWRSKTFHDVAWKNLGDSGLPDRVRWISAAAAERPFMDVSRVGIYGGSAGGQSALRALLAHGDFYKAAVADCGCHDNRMDKIWWNELWMGWPIGPHYEEQSNVTNAHRLQGELLLIVGELDRNVDPASTMQVVDALINADKDFELLIMPGVGHGAAGTPYGRRRLKDFFVRHLLDVEPRWSAGDQTKTAQSR